MNKQQGIILGAGMTGLAAGLASKWPVYEAREAPGGICSSYYMRPGTDKRLNTAPKDEEAYHFEIGGGHWIFGGDPLIHQFLRSLTPVKAYERRSGVFLPEKNLVVPYPNRLKNPFLNPMSFITAAKKLW